MSLLLLLAACMCSAPSTPEAPDDALTVLVIVDTLRADSLGYAGYARATSPNIDALVAEEAAWFSHAYANSSWTLSSTTSLLTGLHPWDHGVVRDHERPELYGRLGAEVPTLASLAGERGMKSAAFINNTFLAPEFGLNQHFDLYDYVGATIISHRSAADTVEAALGWVDDNPGAAFVVLHLMEPHYDYTAPEPFAGRFSSGLPHTLPAPPFGPARLEAWLQRKETPSVEDRAWVRAHYDEEVLTADAAVGQLIAGLKERGRWEGATFALTADHGEELWDYGGFEHGHTLKSAVTHVPMLLKAPGVPTGRCDAVVDHIDLHEALASEALSSTPLYALATGADAGEGRISFAQDTLYGPQEVGAVSAGQRLIIGLHTHEAHLWALDAEGQESHSLDGTPEAQALAGPLIEALRAVRPDLSPTQAKDPRAIEDNLTFQQLQALGYLDR